MPVKIRPELAALAAAAKAPRAGYFSVLDELLGQMPDRPMSLEELRQRLKPNTMLQREDMRFPLKQEEIQYALDPVLNSTNWDRTFTQGKMSPSDLRTRVREARPSFATEDMAADDGGQYSNYATQSPTRLPNTDMQHDSEIRALLNERAQMPIGVGSEHTFPRRDAINEDVRRLGEEAQANNGYFENITESPDFGQTPNSHFTDETLFFSRGTRHGMPSGGTLRLIDEIQNDRANDARSHKHAFDANRGDAPFVEGEIRGWATPEDSKAYNEKLAATTNPFDRRALIMEEGAEMGVPDAPFKTPQEYGRFEIKNQLLSALRSDDAALGITPASGPASWFPGTGAKDTTYDKVYPGELRKIAKQYGADFSPVPLNVRTSDPLNLPSLAGTDITDFIRTADWDRGEPLTAYQQLIDEISPHYKSDADYDPRNGDEDILDQAQQALDDVRDLEAEREHRPANITDGHKDLDEVEGELNDARIEAESKLEELYNAVLEQRSINDPNTTVRNIPSMHLSQEVKDRIARIGLPLFTTAGAAAMTPEMLQSLGAGEDSIPRFAGGGSVLRRVRAGLERGQGKMKGEEMRWVKDLEARTAAQPPRRGRSEDAESYGSYMERRANAPAAKPAIIDVSEDELIRDLPVVEDRRGNPGVMSDLGSLSEFRRLLGLYKGGQVEAHAEGGPVGWAPPQAQNPGMGIMPGEHDWMNQTPFGRPAPQPLLNVPYPVGGGPMPPAPVGAPTGSGGATKGILGSLASSGIESLATKGLSALGTGAGTGTGILSSIGSGLSSMGSSIYGGLAAMGPVGWAAAAAAAAGAVAAKNAPKSSPLNKFDLESGGWSKGENFANQKYDPAALNAYYGPAIAAFKQTGDVRAALAALPKPTNAQEQALYDGRKHLFSGTQNPLRQVAKDMGLKDGAWKASSKEKKALMKELDAEKKASKNGTPALAALQRIATAPNVVALRDQAQATNAAAPKEFARVQPQGARVTPGSNANGLLSQIKQQQAARP